MQQLIESNNQLTIVIANELKNAENGIISRRQVEAISAYLINSVGIRANLKGYSYLKKVIACGVMKPELLHPISKGAYRMASVEFGVNVSCIERNIRLAIDSAYYNSPDRLRSIFPYPGGKPYVSEFIAVAADLIRVELLNSNIELYDEL